MNEPTTRLIPAWRARSGRDAHRGPPSELEAHFAGHRLFCFSVHAARRYTDVRYEPGDGLLFGGESHGLPAGVLERYAERALCIPMPGQGVRSLNVATAAGIALYEALRQLNRW
jgi:tRNA (cytidine/uridine-2'-O-)-methyltransferase